MKSDRELLELAAKAAGLPELRGAGSQHHCYYVLDEQPIKWNPLADDGDALRLAVDLGIHITSSATSALASTETVAAIEPMTPDKRSATVRAIVRASAEIGKDMP